MLVRIAARCWILGRWAQVEDSVYLHGDSLEGLVYGLIESQSPLSVLTPWGQVQPQQTLLVYTLGDTTETHETETQKQPLGRSTQGFLFWMEHSGSAHLTLKLGARSKADRSWERPVTEAAQVSAAAQPSWFLQLQHPGPEHQPTPYHIP